MRFESGAVRSADAGGLRLVAALLLATILLHVTACAGARCRLERVPVVEAPGDPSGEYLAKRGSIEIVFRDFGSQHPVEVFPEPPLIVRDLGTGRECRIEEGGIWVRDAVFLSADGSTLVVKEYSGSNDWLAFYGTADCGKKAEIDLSAARWEIAGDRVRVGRDCSGEHFDSCRSVGIHVLDERCVPRREGGVVSRPRGGEGPEGG